MASTSVDVPRNGGFNFDLCRRNEMLVNKGVALPSYRKTGTTIVGLVFQALNSAGINSFETFIEADPRRIEIVTGRKYPFGNHIKASLLSLPPKVELKVEEIECHKQGTSKWIITLTRLSQLVSSSKRHRADIVFFLLSSIVT